MLFFFTGCHVALRKRMGVFALKGRCAFDGAVFFSLMEVLLGYSVTSDIKRMQTQHMVCSLT